MINRKNGRPGNVIAVLLGTFLIWSTACAVGPKYRRPEITPPETFRGAEGQASSTGAQSLGDAKWFEVFKDEQLQQLIRTAVASNYDVRDAAARVEAARANLGITRADQLPTISGSGNVTALRYSRRGQFPVPSDVSVERRFGTVGLNLLSYEVDLWGRLRSATEAARASLLATEENRNVVLTTLVSDVATSYFNLLELDLELDIAHRTLVTRQNSLQLIQERRQAGLATLLDVRQGEQLVYSATQAIPDLERASEQTENQISLLLGRSPGTVKRGRLLAEQEQPPAVPPGLPSSLLERRPDIRAAEQNLIGANATIGVARAAYFPQISLTGLLGFQSNQLSNLFTGPSGVWQFVPQITQPIFTGGRIKSNVQLARTEQQIALIQYERTIQTSFREVSDALIQYQKVKEVRAQQELLLNALQDRSQLAYVRYRGGVDTLLNALDADRDLFNAQLDLARTRRNEMQALVELYKALGGGWQE